MLLFHSTFCLLTSILVSGCHFFGQCSGQQKDQTKRWCMNCLELLALRTRSCQRLAPRINMLFRGAAVCDGCSVDHAYDIDKLRKGSLAPQRVRKLVVNSMRLYKS